MLILSNKEDRLSLALFSHLRTTNSPVQLVTAEELVFAQSWEHTLDKHGKTVTRIELRDGRIIHSAQLKVVFNRTRYFLMPHFVNSTDRNYAEMEIYALYVGFLRSINHLLIEPLSTRQLTLDQENTFFYFQKAVEAGVPVLDCHYTSSPRMYPSPLSMPVAPPKSSTSYFPEFSQNLVRQNQPALFLAPFSTLSTINVVGNTIVGNDRIPYGNELKDFARSIGKTFLELVFAETRGGFRLCRVNEFPRLVNIDAVAVLANLMIERYGNAR